MPVKTGLKVFWSDIERVGNGDVLTSIMVAVLSVPSTFSAANVLANRIGDFKLATLTGRDMAEIPNNFGMRCPILLPRIGSVN